MRTAALIAVLLATPLAARAQQHPRLFFTAEDAPGLAARAGGTHAAIFGSLRSGTDYFVGSRIASSGVASWSDGRTSTLGDRRDIGNALAVFAFVWQLDGGQAYLDLARSWLLAVASWPTFDLDGERDLVQAHLLGGAAIAYDILWPTLSDAQRSTVRWALARDATALMDAGKSGIWWSSEITQNHNWINHAAVGLAALAIEGEVAASSSDAWLRFAVDNARRIREATSGIVDGTWHEGFGYQTYGYHWHLPFIEALKRAGKEDLTDLRMLRGAGAARLHGQIAEAPHTYVLAYGDFSSFLKDEALLPLRYAASRYGDRLAQAAADRWSAGTPRYTYAPESNQQIFEFLWYDPAVPAADLATLPLDWYGPDAQAVVFRSGHGPGSTIFAMKSGTFGGRSVWQRLAAGDAAPGGLNFSHDHADDNGFYLYANGTWLAPEAQGYYIGHADSPPPEANRTIFHNSLLVDGQGQLGEGVRPSGDEHAAYPWFFQREGTIPFHASTSNYAYAIADGSKLYAASLGLTRWDRHALFIDRRFVLLRDVVEATQSHAYRWLIHLPDGVAREGSWLRGSAKNGQALGVAVVSPVQWNLSSAAQAPHKIGNFDPDGSVWVAEVVPAAPSANATFVTVLVPTPAASWASRPQVAALDPASPSVGARVAEGGREFVALFGPAGGGTRDVAGWSVTGVAAVVEQRDGSPSRAVVVNGSAVSGGSRALIRLDPPAPALEADGLTSETLALTGDARGSARIWAPNARRVLWNGVEVAFSRSGELVELLLAADVHLAAPSGRAGDPEASPPPVGGGAGETPVVAAAAGGGCRSGLGDSISVLLVLAVLVAALRLRRRLRAARR